MAVLPIILRAVRAKGFLDAACHSAYRFAIAVSMRACAKRRETVAGCTSKRRAASAAVLLPLETILMISACCCGLSFGRRPPMRPCLRALSRPILVRSRSIARSNSANEPSICSIMRPAGFVVSIASLKLLNPAFAFAICSMIVKTSRSERESRSSFHTTSTSPSGADREVDAVRDGSTGRQKPSRERSARILPFSAPRPVLLYPVRSLRRGRIR
jgi:hypothetical protein